MKDCFFFINVIGSYKKCDYFSNYVTDSFCLWSLRIRNESSSRCQGSPHFHMPKVSTTHQHAILVLDLLLIFQHHKPAHSLPLSLYSTQLISSRFPDSLSTFLLHSLVTGCWVTDDPLQSGFCIVSAAIDFNQQNSWSLSASPNWCSSTAESKARVWHLWVVTTPLPGFALAKSPVFLFLHLHLCLFLGTSKIFQIDLSKLLLHSCNFRSRDLCLGPIAW